MNNIFTHYHCQYYRSHRRKGRTATIVDNDHERAEGGLVSTSRRRTESTETDWVSVCTHLRLFLASKTPLCLYISTLTSLLPLFLIVVRISVYTGHHATTCELCAVEKIRNLIHYY